MCFTKSKSGGDDEITTHFLKFHLFLTGVVDTSDGLMNEIKQGFIIQIHSEKYLLRYKDCLVDCRRPAEVAPDVSEETDIVLGISSAICEASNKS